jgi:hypothetical protein
VLVATGCGSSGGSSDGYSLALTEKCLKASGLKAFPVKNDVVSGSQGNLHVEFTYGTEDIFMAFGKNPSEAKKIREEAIAATERHQHIDRQTILDGVEVAKNVFYYSNAGPLTQVTRQRIIACLR